MAPRRATRASSVHYGDLLCDESESDESELEASDASEELSPVKEVVVNPIRRRVSVKEELPLVHCPYEGCSFCHCLESVVKRHMKVHEGEKRFKCGVEGCGYATNKRDHMRTHMRVHTGEKPFKCSVEGCGFAATQSSDLKKHMRTHTGEKPYKCPFEGCDYQATQSGILKQHMKTHTKYLVCFTYSISSFKGMKNADSISLSAQCPFQLSLSHVVLGVGNADFSPLLSCIAFVSEQCKPTFGIKDGDQCIETSVFFRRSTIPYPSYWTRRRSAMRMKRPYLQTYLTTCEGIRTGASNSTNYFVLCMSI